MAAPWTFHLGQLHHVIQAAFGWWDYHLHQFVIGGLRYGEGTGTLSCARGHRCKLDKIRIRSLAGSRGRGTAREAGLRATSTPSPRSGLPPARACGLLMERACHRGARGGSCSRPYRFTLRLDRDDWLGIADPATCNTSLFG
ncbi:MAG: plasmid pRiA4b ORF-3 family protein [Chloroflexota bacterium]|nr:plasmid pRiA4b ORF-3 family protein [Chloroflexota bacterium]